MVDGIDDKDKKIKGVNKPNTLDQIKKSEAINQVKKTGKVQSVDSTTNAPRRSTRVMTAAEREGLFKMVEEEAEKLFGSNISSEQRSVIETAVKQTIDAAIIEDDDDNEEDNNKTQA